MSANRSRTSEASAFGARSGSRHSRTTALASNSASIASGMVVTTRRTCWVEALPMNLLRPRAERSATALAIHPLNHHTTGIERKSRVNAKLEKRPTLVVLFQKLFARLRSTEIHKKPSGSEAWRRRASSTSLLTTLVPRGGPGCMSLTEISE